MSAGQVDEWLHADRGAPWKKANGGEIMGNPMAMGGTAPLGDPYREPPREPDNWMDALKMHRTGHPPRSPDKDTVDPDERHPMDSALRSASAVTQRPHLQFGGQGMPMSQAIPWFARAAAREDIHDAGLLQSEIPGRTDHIPVSVASGAYVIPADVVSGLGEGNSLAGARILNHALGIGPYGTQLPRARGHNTLPRPPHNPYSEQNAPGEGDRLLEGKPYAAGGQVENGKAVDVHGQHNPVPIMAAGNEFVVPPHIVHQLGGGDPNDADPRRREKHLKQGHDMLDAWVVHERKKHIKTLQKLPGPSK